MLELLFLGCLSQKWHILSACDTMPVQAECGMWSSIMWSRILCYSRKSCQMPFSSNLGELIRAAGGQNAPGWGTRTHSLLHNSLVKSSGPGDSWASVPVGLDVKFGKLPGELLQWAQSQLVLFALQVGSVSDKNLCKNELLWQQPPDSPLCIMNVVKQKHPFPLTSENPLFSGLAITVQKESTNVVR